MSASFQEGRYTDSSCIHATAPEKDEDDFISDAVAADAAVQRSMPTARMRGLEKYQPEPSLLQYGLHLAGPTDPADSALTLVFALSCFRDVPGLKLRRFDRLRSPNQRAPLPPKRLTIKLLP
jgi:hypothetical protein